jgi:hypothetical protein
VFTIFDKEAEKLIGKTAKELAHMQFVVRNHNLFVLLLQNKFKKSIITQYIQF